MISCENNLNTLTFLRILTSGKSSSLFYSVLTLITKSKVEASRISLLPRKLFVISSQKWYTFFVETHLSVTDVQHEASS